MKTTFAATAALLLAATAAPAFAAPTTLTCNVPSVADVEAQFAAFNGAWAAFARYRIPTVKSDRHAADGFSALRERRLKQARERRLDHFRAWSASTRSNFSLTVERLDEPGLPREGVPNSYGLCSRAAPFALPELPP